MHQISDKHGSPRRKQHNLVENGPTMGHQWHAHRRPCSISVGLERRSGQYLDYLKRRRAAKSRQKPLANIHLEGNFFSLTSKDQIPWFLPCVGRRCKYCSVFVGMWRFQKSGFSKTGPLRANITPSDLSWRQRLDLRITFFNKIICSSPETPNCSTLISEICSIYIFIWSIDLVSRQN